MITAELVVTLDYNSRHIWYSSGTFGSFLTGWPMKVCQCLLC